ncbi:retrovirus-related pol polyprotein from transposon TNT 1-94 [Tanacetum coccineum]
MHNDIMAAGSRDRPLMLAIGRYAQWQSRFMRYVDTRPNSVALRKCIPQGPYILSEIKIPRQLATDDSLKVPSRTVSETFLNISPENKAHYDAEDEVIHLILIGIGDDIYSTIDACTIAKDMRIAIERLQQVVAGTQQYPNMYYQAPKSLKSYATPARTSSSNRSHVTTKTKGKEIAKPITPPSESASEEDRTQVVQLSGIQCFNHNEFGHFAKECRKPKRAKDYTYHKEKMLLCKQTEKGVPLCAEQTDWLDDTNEELDEQELEAHHIYMQRSRRHHSEQYEFINDTYVVEKVDSNVIPDSSNMCNNEDRADQNADECDDERAVLANLIANLKLDTDKNKKIQKQLKKANTPLSHKLRECKSALE